MSKYKAEMERLAPKPEQLDKLDSLLIAGYELGQACDIVGISRRYADNKLKARPNQAKAMADAEAINALRESFKRNPITAIFYAKAKLGWIETSRTEQKQEVTLVDIPSQESREAWEKRQAKNNPNDYNSLAEPKPDLKLVGS